MKTIKCLNCGKQIEIKNTTFWKRYCSNNCRQRAWYKKHFKKSVATLAFLLLASSAFAEIASFYGNGEKLNEFTASGRRFDPTEMGAAMYGVPFGTDVKVTNLANGKSAVVKVLDRGPNKRLGRKIDLYREAFRKIADLKEGLINVSVEVLP